MTRRIEWATTSGRTSCVTVTEDMEVSPLMLMAYAQQNARPWPYGQQNCSLSCNVSYGNAAAQSLLGGIL